MDPSENQQDDSEEMVKMTAGDKCSGDKATMGNVF